MKKIFLIGCLTLLTACNLGVSTATAPIPSLQAPTQTPPLLATPTQTVTPAPTLTPTPVPLFFTEEFNTDMSAWTSFTTGGEIPPSIEITNDQLRVSLQSPNTWYYAIHNAHDYEDVFVTTKFTGSPTGSAGLICRYTDEGWIEYNIASDGTYNLLIGSWVAEGIAQYRPILNDTVEYIKPGTFEYEAGLTCQGNFVSLHVNGKLFRKFDISPYFEATSGKVGINASSFDDAPANIQFDSFQVSEP
jgi:hypothetical protein